MRRIVAIGGALVLLVFAWVLASNWAEAAGQNPKGKPAKPPTDKCNNVTAAAVFRDAADDGLKSDGQTVYGAPLYGSVSEYHGWEDSLVCLMEYDDWDFIMGTTSTAFEKNGWNRMASLNFPTDGPDPVPFATPLMTEVLIRSDYVYNINDPGPRRLIVWFTVGRTDYKLYFDDGEGTNQVQVAVSGSSPTRIWTIESFGWGRLEGPRKVGIVGYYYMPFKITIHETDQPKTCL